MRFILGALTVASLLLGACGGDDSAPAKATNTSAATTAAATETPTPEPTQAAPVSGAAAAPGAACAILPQPETEKAMGLSLYTDQVTGSQCSYFTGANERVTIQLVAYGSPEAASQAITQYLTNGPKQPATYTDMAEATGFGDRAVSFLYHYADRPDTSWTLLFIKGASGVMVSITNRGGDTKGAGMVRELARIAYTHVTSDGAAILAAVTPAAAAVTPGAAAVGTPTKAAATQPATTPAATSKPVYQITDAAAFRSSVLQAGTSFQWQMNNEDGGFTAYLGATYPGLRANGYGITATNSISIYFGNLNSKNTASATNPIVYAFAVSDVSGKCAAGAIKGYPTPSSAVTVDIGSAACNGGSVLAALWQ